MEFAGGNCFRQHCTSLNVMDDYFCAKHISKSVGFGVFARVNIRKGQEFLYTCAMLPQYFISNHDFSKYVDTNYPDFKNDFWFWPSSFPLLPLGMALLVNDGNGPTKLGDNNCVIDYYYYLLLIVIRQDK